MLDNKGVTIIELIIYLAIFAVIGTTAMGVLNYTLKSRTAISQTSDVLLNTQRILARMTDRINAAQSINSASASTLDLKMADGAKDPTVFTLSSGSVTIQEGAAAAALLNASSTRIKALSFLKIDNLSPATSSVQIVITGCYNVDSSCATDSEYTLQTTVAPI